MQFLPDEDILLPPQVTPRTQGWAGFLIWPPHEAILTHRNSFHCAQILTLPGPQLIPRTPHPLSFRP